LQVEFLEIGLFLKDRAGKWKDRAKTAKDRARIAKDRDVELLLSLQVYRIKSTIWILSWILQLISEINNILKNSTT
jgi:hypothetical protein